MDCCVSESRIPSNGQPLDGVTIGFFACGREEKRPSSCHLTDRHIRACQSGHFLKTASLHPPPAALQRFSRWRQNQLFALVAPAVRRTHSYPPNGVLLESGLLYPPLAALRRFPRRVSRCPPCLGPTIDTYLRTFAASAAVPTKYTLTDKLYY
mgnify:CR=1 FL=1